MLRLVLEYDGSDFHGWQSQSSVRTVEGVFRDAVRQVTGESPRLSAAGRTDAGAHSHGQVVGLPLSSEWEPQRLSSALNAVLPSDVAVRSAERAPAGFHARFDALNRTYRYVVTARRERAPLLRRHAWQCTGDLDIVRMRDAASLLSGRHDFAAFGRSPRPGGSTERTVERATVRRVAAPVADETRAYVIEVSADAFLYGMMRAIAGALVAVGRGRMSVEDVGRMLTEPKACRTVTVAPARGLHQWSVTYPEAAASETSA
jgi:tRNA pseudouridine38-40 synthase